MRGHIKLFTLQMDVERSRRCSHAMSKVTDGLDEGVMLLVNQRCHSLQELTSGK